MIKDVLIFGMIFFFAVFTPAFIIDQLTKYIKKRLNK